MTPSPQSGEAHSLPHDLLDNAHTHLSWIKRHHENNSGYASVCAASCDDWDQLAEAARQAKGTIIPSFGVHPWHLDNAPLDWEQKLSALLDEFPHAGIGETGLDKTPQTHADIETQTRVLETHISIATQYDRVLTLHCVKAWGRLLDTLRQHRPQLFLIHGWNGPQELIKDFTSLGAFFSIGTRTLHTKDAAYLLPLIPPGRLLIETDEQTENLQQTFDLLLTHVDTEPHHLAAQLHSNFCQLFRQKI